MHTICKQCLAPFTVTEPELGFLEMMSPEIGGTRFSIPAPTFCPPCRLARRTAFRNERKLYHRTCDLCKNAMLSIYSPHSSHKVYCKNCWWGDGWSPTEYAREIDWNRPFFEQFYELYLATPQLSSFNVDSENSDFCNWTWKLKDCYLLSGSNVDERCMYGSYLNDSRECWDVLMVTQSELCYECVECDNCYKSAFLKNSKNCRDSYFLENCSNCENCFGCVNMQHKSFCFFNKQLTKEEYQHKLQEMRPWTRQGLDQARATFREFRLRFPYSFMVGEGNEDVTGNSISNSRESYGCFDVTEVECCYNCTWLHKSKDCMDVFSFGRTAERLYECLASGGGAYNLLWTLCGFPGSQNIMYSIMVPGAQDAFGCVSLKSHRFCILNKQYTEEEYKKTVARLIEHMQKTGEWGEMFPASMSPFAYNETIAQEFVPLDKATAEDRGCKWLEEEGFHAYVGEKKLPPENLTDATEALVREEIYTCTLCDKNFKVTPQELALHLKMHIALPAACASCRYGLRDAMRTPKRLWQRPCMKCGVALQTAYSPERPEIIYCSSCYSEGLV